MATLSLFPARIPFVDDSGCLTPEAYRALKEVFSRIGGPLGDTGIDVFAPVVEIQGDGLDAIVQPTPTDTNSAPDIVQPAQADYGPFVEMVMQPMRFGSLSSMDANAVAITGGTIDGTVIGGTTPAAGTFTTLTTTGSCRINTAFGCNGKTAQTAYASGGAVATTGATNTTPYGFTTAAQADGIVTLINNIRSALVANGIMS